MGVRENTLIRVHSAARLTLFTLGKVLVQECRVKGADFIRKRRTFVQTAHAAKQAERGLLERWTGETHFE